MSRLHLRLFQPPVEEDQTATEPKHEPRNILPFESPGQTTILSGRYTAPVERSRVIHNNAACPECDGLSVSPIELDDAVISPKNRLPIPGTSTIVGFHCNDCASEWPVYELTTRRNG